MTDYTELVGRLREQAAIRDEFNKRIRAGGLPAEPSFFRAACLCAPAADAIEALSKRVDELSFAISNAAGDIAAYVDRAETAEAALAAALKGKPLSKPDFIFDSYADENERLHIRAEAAEAALEDLGEEAHRRETRALSQAQEWRTRAEELEREKNMSLLAAQAQELGLGYGPDALARVRNDALEEAAKIADNEAAMWGARGEIAAAIRGRKTR